MNGKIIEVTGGPGGYGFLLNGAEKAALIDGGMAYSAPQLISNIKRTLGARPLDYIFISHSHYDHIGAIPHLRREWPACQVLGAEHARQVLRRPGALATIRRLGRQAAELYGGEWLEYDDKQLQVDRTMRDGDAVDLGGLRIAVLATPGHTQCSLSYLVNGKTLFASESTGCLSTGGQVCPAFIISSAAALEAIRRCQRINPCFIYSPHYGLVGEREALGYWERCRQAVLDAKAFVLQLAGQGHDEGSILIQYEQRFRDEDSRREQPYEAFCLNARPMIKTVLREAAERTVPGRAMACSAAPGY